MSEPTNQKSGWTLRRTSVCLLRRGYQPTSSNRQGLLKPIKHTRTRRQQTSRRARSAPMRTVSRGWASSIIGRERQPRRRLLPLHNMSQRDHMLVSRYSISRETSLHRNMWWARTLTAWARTHQQQGQGRRSDVVTSISRLGQPTRH